MQQRNFFPTDSAKLLTALGKERLLGFYRQMCLIRNFELRAEAAYQQGRIGGFFHSYMGQEAIQTAAVAVAGVPNNWYIASYRCHALALLLGASPNELMAELFGCANGNAMGRGGSMHFYTERMLGGFGIVAGQLPVALGAAFSLKYQKQSGAAFCFFGDGAVAQGAFHESLNLAALWDLPVLFVVENNHWGMGTPVEAAVSVTRLAEDKAASYGIEGFSIDGMDLFHCYEAFSHFYQKVVKSSRPLLIEAVTDRFRGHSISDPGLYRTKESLKTAMERDPLQLVAKQLIAANFATDDELKGIDLQAREEAIAAMRFAEESPQPHPAELEEGVFAPPVSGCGL